MASHDYKIVEQRFLSGWPLGRPAVTVCWANIKTLLGVGWLLEQDVVQERDRDGVCWLFLFYYVAGENAFLPNEATPSADMFKDKAARKKIIFFL